jgi:predicted double-glycine peptidase
VTLNGTQVGMASFLHLLTKATIMVQTKRTSSSLLLPNDTLPSKISENFNPGSVSKTSYINFAYLIANYMNKYNRAPAYGSFTLGKANYKSQIYLFSTVMDFYNSYNRLPYRVYMTPFKEESKSTLGWVGVSNLVYYQQPNSYSCGPSSLKMVLSTYGLSISESWLETAAGTTSSSGTSHSGLINAVQKVNNAYGTHFSAWDENLSSRTWTGLYSTFISKNHPVILHVKSWLSSGGHYVVLAGLSLKDQMAKLADPSYGGYRYVSFSDLEYRMGWVTSTGISDNPIIAITN